MDADGLTSVSYTYQWIRAANVISGATASTYTLVAGTGHEDQGDGELHRRCRLPRGADQRDDGDRHGALPNTPATGAPTITGTPQVGQTLTAGTTGIMDADGLTSVSYTYQWIRVDQQHRGAHPRGDGKHLHAGGGRPGHDDQGKGELHRRRQQRRDADQRGDGGRRGGEHPPTASDGTVTTNGTPPTRSPRANSISRTPMATRYQT